MAHSDNAPREYAPGPDDALFPSEFDTTLLTLGVKKRFGPSDDWSMELLYDGLPLQLQTPWMRNVFGITRYVNPGGRDSYSLSWELEPTGDVGEFASFLGDLDTWFEEYVKKEGIKENYHSSVRPCNKYDDEGKPRFNPTFRVKLKQRYDNFACTFLESRVAKRWPVTDCERVQRGDMCRMIIELLPVWCAGGKVGTTWKAVTLQKQRETISFRRN